MAKEKEPLPEGAVLASALMAANYGGDSGEDVDRLIAELAKRGYRLQSDADDDDILQAVSDARKDTPSLLARWPEADLFAALDAEGWFRGLDTKEAARATSKVYARLARGEPDAG